ncbi:MAG: alpha/beta fold hydrolase [Nannocystales bacterium]
MKESPTLSASLPSRLRRVSLGPVDIALRSTPGQGLAVLYIHGSLEDHRGWQATIDALQRRRSCHTVAYDRRGHGCSTDVSGQGTLSADVDDAEALIAQELQGVAHVIGHSYGATVAMELARRCPTRVASLFLHEPPLFGLLRDDPDLFPLLVEAKAGMSDAMSLIRAGEVELGVEAFIDRVAFGPGTWRNGMDTETRGRMLCHADTWLDQARDPQRLSISLEGLRTLVNRATLSTGSRSLPTFDAVSKRVLEAFPQLRRVVVDGGGHDAPATHPEVFADLVDAHLGRTPKPLPS